MTPQDIRTLRLLEALEADSCSSQRDLARRLDVSLGLVNAFIRRLAKKGYFKITHIPKSRARYILTPKGAVEKTRLTYAYIRYSISFYRDARQRFGRLFRELQGNGVKTVILYGAGELAEIAYISMLECAIRPEAIVDEDNGAQTLMGISVKAPDQVDWSGGAPVLLTCLEENPSAVDRLLALGVDAGRIVRMR